MSNGSGNTSLALIIQCHYTNVGKGKLDFTGTLLTGNLSRHRTVHLICKPVLAGYGFETQYILEVAFKLFLTIDRRLIMFFDAMVGNDSARRLAEHIFKCKIDGMVSLLVVKDELHVARGLSNHIERSPFTVCNTP